MGSWWAVVDKIMSVQTRSRHIEDPFKTDGNRGPIEFWRNLCGGELSGQTIPMGLPSQSCILDVILALRGDLYFRGLLSVEKRLRQGSIGLLFPSLLKGSSIFPPPLPHHPPV